MDILTLYNKYIYDRYNSLLKSGKEEFDNKDLSKIFEYYTAIKLSEQYGQLFYEYTFYRFTVYFVSLQSPKS